MSTETSRNRAQTRLNRLPPMAQRLVTNRTAAHQYLTLAPMVRLMFAAGVSPERDMGVENHDAIVAIIKDALGIAPLSDEQFEHALHLSTPPECREPTQ